MISFVFETDKPEEVHKLYEKYKTQIDTLHKVLRIEQKTKVTLKVTLSEELLSFSLYYESSPYATGYVKDSTLYITSLRDTLSLTFPDT